MHLLLTHEQADFDGLASLLAIHLLEPEAHAVEPARANRNVRAFLSLYGEELPLERMEDLPKERIEKITLVDTQSIPTIRGVDSQTQVRVLDHHPLHRPLGEGWTAVLEPLGATTTLLVEALEERAEAVQPMQATLLLLGIYEDTGSLSYPGTTSRDIRAAAWLLEQGASLPLAADFLNHPFSEEQRRLYDRLVEKTETLDVHGQRILIAQASAPPGVEEISSLAHKLRDLFDPDGLFLLVDLGSHIQMVARSTSDCVDVAEVASRFGGGGHNRAAAALIRGKTLAQANTELIAILPAAVRPPLQVAQMYSPRPQVVEAELPVAEAAERMARYGYEGFPVVRDHKVVGLLTRRAVDRTLAHGMAQAPVESIMEAGTVSVQLTDSIAHLQYLMVDSGWGQIPVVSPDDGSVLGIVTRTDLLKALAPGPSSTRMNLRDRLERYFPPPYQAILRAVASSAEKKHFSLYLVGGVVRDLLLGTSSVDLDLVVEGDAIALAKSLSREYGGRVRSHDQFGTAEWLVADADLGKLGIAAEESPILPDGLDLVSARAEFYAHPSALPEVERGNLKLDLHRRDFTINTLALSLNTAHYGEVYDYWGGLRDLEEKCIRVLHSISFVDDPTRILRAARLEQRLGFSIEPRTRDLIAGALPLLHRVSGDRLRHELEAIFTEADPQRVLARLGELGALSQIHPDLTWDPAFAGPVTSARNLTPSPEWGLSFDEGCLFPPMYAWLAALGRHSLQEILSRLNFPQRTAALILSVRSALDALLALPPDAKPSRIVDVLDGLSDAALIGVWLESAGPIRGWVEAFLCRWRKMLPKADGETLRRMGLPPGPRYRSILRALRHSWVDGEVTSPEEETRYLQRFVEARG